MNRYLIEEARGHLGAALIQTIQSDDKIIVEHIRVAEGLLKAALSEPQKPDAGPEPCPTCGGKLIASWPFKRLEKQPPADFSWPLRRGT